MEAYKYVTQLHLDRIQREGQITPRRSDGRTYGIPEDPDLWGEQITDVFDHLMKRGVSPIVLLRFIFDDEDPEVGIQEGNVPVWDKFETRIWVRDYVREDFDCPEVVVFRPIKLGEIELLGQVIPNSQTSSRRPSLKA